MCENYKLCGIKKKLQPRRALTLLLLDCWQREYDSRPYRNFGFKRLDLEKRLERDFQQIDDLIVITEFLNKRRLSSVSLLGFGLPIHRDELVKSFVDSLWKLRRIELKLMYLPTIFFEFLRDNVTGMNVRELILEGSKLATADIEALHTFIEKSKTLQRLNVARCNVSQYDFPLLADGVHKSVSMRSFNFSRLTGSRLTLDTIKVAHIVSSLLWQNKLVEIEMQLCEFQAHDMEILSEYLEHCNCKLRKLNLACNRISVDGAEYLFRAIACSSTLVDLDISSNGLGSHGGIVVAHYLSSCYSLECLNITDNGIGPDAMFLIITTMKKPIKLRSLKVWGNDFSKKSATAIRRLLDARVVMQETIDVTAVYDESLLDYRVIPYY